MLYDISMIQTSWLPRCGSFAMMQTSCLISEEGWRNFLAYDDFPQAIRDILKDSKYNLCCECIKARAFQIYASKLTPGNMMQSHFPISAYLQAIGEMVRIIDERQMGQAYVEPINRYLGYSG